MRHQQETRRRRSQENFSSMFLPSKITRVAGLFQTFPVTATSSSLFVETGGRRSRGNIHLKSSLIFLMLVFVNIARSRTLGRSSSLSLGSLSPSSPTFDPIPRFIDHCKARPLDFAIDQHRDFLESSNVNNIEVYDAIIAATRRARTQAEKTKVKFISSVMRAKPQHLESALEDWKQKWLPEIPVSSSPEYFANHFKTTEDAFQTAFKILQYFAVGIQQVLLDIVLYDGKMWPEFNRIENQLYQITCEIKLGMYSKGFNPDSHVLREVMTFEFRYLDDASDRNRRDYLILRDYVKAVNFIMEIFSYIRSKELLENRTKEQLFV